MFELSILQPNSIAKATSSLKVLAELPIIVVLMYQVSNCSFSYSSRFYIKHFTLVLNMSNANNNAKFVYMRL